MKKLNLLLISLFICSFSFALETGKKAPAFTLETPTGESVSLSDFEGKIVVLEWVNPFCPFVKKFYQAGAMQKFQKEAAVMNVVWLSINSTNPNHGDYLNPEESVEWLKENKVESIWLLDATGKVGKLYEAKRTPHMYIINESGVLIYQGAIDSIRDADPKSIDKAENFVMNALASLETENLIEKSDTVPYGCSIKY